MNHKNDPQVWPTKMTHEFDPQEWLTILTQEFDSRQLPTSFAHEFEPQELPTIFTDESYPLAPCGLSNFHFVLKILLLWKLDDSVQYTYHTFSLSFFSI